MKRTGSSLLLGLLGCAGPHLLAAGEGVPEIEAKNQDGAPVRLSQFRGHPLVVYFYPKDRTPGCTTEAHAFREDYERFRALGAEIVGVSNDDVASHKNFCTKDGLPFPLLADTDKTIARAFGVPTRFGFYKRMTFVIDGAGVVRRVYQSVSPAGHAREVLADVQALS